MSTAFSRPFRSKQIRSRQKGVAIIGVLFFILITSILLMGVGTYAVSHQTRVVADLNYAQAMDLAEAGEDYEFRKISLTPTGGDQFPGTTVTFGQGTFTVYCMNKDGSTPWNPSTYLSPYQAAYLYVVSTGTVNGVTRTVKVSSKGYAPAGKYAIYTINNTSIWSGNSATINGDVGTNYKFQFSANPPINGSIYFNGPNAGWSGSAPSGYTTVTTPQPIQWPTVDQVANTSFPLGGLTWLATHNNNASANPPIVSNSITDAVTLTAGDYYVENLNLTGSKQISFDNRNGPVNLWIGPAGATGTARFRGGTAYVPISVDPTKANHIYVATKSGIDLGGNSELDALVYAYNKDASGNEYGYATNSGNPHIVGQVIANQYDLNGNIQLDYVTDLIKPISYGYYGYDNSWVEINPR